MSRVFAVKGGFEMTKKFIMTTMTKVLHGTRVPPPLSRLVLLCHKISAASGWWPHQLHGRSWSIARA